MRRRDRKIARYGLRLAIDWQLSLIDAHRTELKRMRTGLYEKVVPKEYQKDVARWRRDIRAFQRLIRELGDESGSEAKATTGP